VGFTEGSTPVTSPDGDDGQFGEDDSAADGGSDFLGALDTETDVTVKVTDSDEGLEAGTLAGAGLLLHGHDLHDLVLEFGEEEVDDLEFLDGEREKVDLLHRLDLAILDETAEFGDRDPLLLLIFAASTAGSTAASATTTSTSKSTTSTGSVSHFLVVGGGRYWVRSSQL